MALFNRLKKALQKKPTLETQQEVVRGLVTSKIYALMAELSISKADLAGKLEVSKATVTGWLSGNRNFTIDTLTQIGYALNKTPRFDFIPLDDRHEATLRSLPTAAAQVDFTSKEDTLVQASSYTIKIVSNG